MGTPFLSEIRICSFNFPPKGWALCNGQLLPINQNQALFALLGTTYGGNGQTNFALPDLRGRTPIHEGEGHTLGERGGAEAHTLNIQQLPTHIHVAAAASGSGTTPIPTGAYLGRSPTPFYRAPDASPAAMNPGSITNTGGSQPHTNLQPYLVLTFCIALQGIFPSQN